jgi:glycosyltransferase involved in cell wall biosynthesis
MDVVSFVSREQAQPWLEAGLLDSEQPIVELMEGSSHFNLKHQTSSRRKTGLTGEPLCLWVGRLDANKDPLTILLGFAKALPSIPNAQLVMVYSSTSLLPAIEKWLAENSSVSRHVQLLGQRPHEDLEDVYNSADMFLLGSHKEASGYAVLEALACGVVPILTDIPSFRVLTGYGTVGGLWPCGDAEALAIALRVHAQAIQPETRHKVRAYFETNFHWDTIGQRALTVYRRILSVNG